MQQTFLQKRDILYTGIRKNGLSPTNLKRAIMHRSENDFMKNTVKVITAHDGTKTVEIRTKVKLISITVYDKGSKTVSIKDYKVNSDLAPVAIDQIKKSLIATGYKIVDVEKTNDFDVQSYPLNYLVMLANECDEDGAIYSKYMRELTADEDTNKDTEKDGE